MILSNKKNMKKHKIKKRADKIDKIYKKFQSKLDKLKSKKGDTIQGFIKKAEQKELKKYQDLLK